MSNEQFSSLFDCNFVIKISVGTNTYLFLCDCTAKFRFFWLNSMITEAGACDPFSHKYRFSPVKCDQSGLYAAFAGACPSLM